MDRKVPVNPPPLEVELDPGLAFLEIHVVRHVRQLEAAGCHDFEPEDDIAISTTILNPLVITHPQAITDRGVRLALDVDSHALDQSTVRLRFQNLPSLECGEVFPRHARVDNKTNSREI